MVFFAIVLSSYSIVYFDFFVAKSWIFPWAIFARDELQNSGIEVFGFGVVVSVDEMGILEGYHDEVSSSSSSFIAMSF